MNLIDLIIRPRQGISHTRRIVNLLSGYLYNGQKILDYGAGDCRIAQEIIRRFQVDVTPLDVTDYNKTNLKLFLYDGKKIPFPDKCFDLVTSVFVLHHSTDQLNNIRELKRVAKSKIIIIEDTPKNKFEKLTWRFWDWLLNLGHNVAMAYSARTQKEWLKIFKENGLKIVALRNFRPWQPALGMYQQTMFVLEKQ